MNKIKRLLTILSLAPVLCQAQTSTENYVMTETRLDANGTNAVKSVQYYNGLGYPTVSVANVGGSGQTAYSLTTYDAVGRSMVIACNCTVWSRHSVCHRRYVTADCNRR